MAVLRITANIAHPDPAQVADFYRQVLGLQVAMDMGWIVTLAGEGPGPIQLSTMSEGGSGTPVPPLSVEVDDLDGVLDRARSLGHAPEYGPVDEPWGVRRAFLRDPAGTLVNVLVHLPGA